MQVPWRGARQPPQHHVADSHHLPQCGLRRHRPQHLLRARHCCYHWHDGDYCHPCFNQTFLRSTYPHLPWLVWDSFHIPWTKILALRYSYFLAFPEGRYILVWKKVDARRCRAEQVSRRSRNVTWDPLSKFTLGESCHSLLLPAVMYYVL